MKILYLLLYVAGICFCIIGLVGHAAAWAVAALSFFSATMIIIGQRKNKNDTNRKNEETDNRK